MRNTRKIRRQKKTEGMRDRNRREKKKRETRSKYENKERDGMY